MIGSTDTQSGHTQHVQPSLEIKNSIVGMDAPDFKRAQVVLLQQLVGLAISNKACSRFSMKLFRLSLIYGQARTS
jgi:hypothetical protein